MSVAAGVGLLVLIAALGYLLFHNTGRNTDVEQLAMCASARGVPSSSSEREIKAAINAQIALGSDWSEAYSAVATRDHCPWLKSK